MIAFLTTALLLVLALALVWRWRFLQRLRQLDSMVDELNADEIPATFMFRSTPHFSRVALKLEKLSDAHERLKRQIRQERFNFQAALASMIEGVLVVDAGHVIRLVNQSFCAMFGLAAEPLGQTILGALRAAAIDQVIRDALEHGGVQSREISLTPIAAQPVTRCFEVNALPLRDEYGKTSGVVAVFHDISHLRQLENVRREFVANVSHELRTPLSIFEGHLENLLDRPDTPVDELVSILKIMRKHSRRLHALLEDLLALARLESRQEKLELREIALGAFVETLLREWQPRLAQKRLSAQARVPADLPPLLADPLRLEQVLGNLLDNAIRFSEPGGEIEISASADERQVEIRVQDHGAGIPPADLPHIFKRFYRVEKGRSRDAGGTGLGLSIVKHIAGLHGGSVRAESTFGKGAAIIVSLPRSR